MPTIGTRFGTRGLSIGPHRGRSTTTAEFPAPTRSPHIREGSNMDQSLARVVPGNLLQWRAEQLPGQTRSNLVKPPTTTHGFNGGPSNCPAKPEPVRRMERRRLARFNGGPSNCPAKRVPGTGGLANRDRASMEGRAIARPNDASPLSPTRRSRCFNGGPSNCPAKPAACGSGSGLVVPASMEGRAIARPNVDELPEAPAFWQPASMEGRAIARPNI